MVNLFSTVIIISHKKIFAQSFEFGAFGNNPFFHDGDINTCYNLSDKARSSEGERWPDTPEVGGSSPPAPTML